MHLLDSLNLSVFSPNNLKVDVARQPLASCLITLLLSVGSTLHKGQGRLYEDLWKMIGAIQARGKVKKWDKRLRTRFQAP